MALISVVGIGAGNVLDMTFRADQAIRNADILIGYTTYIELIREQYKDKEVLATGMTKEVERCKSALELALEGKNIALVSSGDSGIYGMAGLMLEIFEDYKEENKDSLSDSCKKVEIEVVPGVTALSLVASRLGAPVMHDFAVISLSDILTPFELIKTRISCAAKGDFVICIYNPRSIKRTEYIEIAKNLIEEHRNPNTPVGIVRNAGRENEEVIVTVLGDLLSHEIDMFCTILIGNSATKIMAGKIVTPRGYMI